MSYPSYTNGEPPVVSLKQYDTAHWAGTTCVDRKDGKYVIVEMENPDKIIASLPPSDYDVLNQIFQGAHADYAKQVHDQDVKQK